MTGLSADLVLRVGAAYSLAGEVYRAVAVRGAEVVAVSADPTAWTTWRVPRPGWWATPP